MPTAALLPALVAGAVAMASAPAKAQPSTPPAAPPVAASPPAPGSTAPAVRAGRPFDQLFVHHEAQALAFEAALAALGQSRAARPEVKQLATTLAESRNTHLATLSELARARHLALPDAPTAAARRRLDALSAQPAAGFDTAFLREVVRANGADLRWYRQEAGRAGDPDLTSFIHTVTDADTQHEQAARALLPRSRAPHSRMPVINPPAAGSNMPVIAPPATGGAMPVIPPPAAAPAMPPATGTPATPNRP